MRKLGKLGVLCLLFCTQVALAEEQFVSLERAQGEDLAVAVGHYARARSLLLAAVREFDQGLKHANPQVLIDVHEWRNSLLDRAEDLERVLDPQPRGSEKGIQFQADTRLLNEAPQ